MPEIIDVIEDTDIIQITSYGEITENDLRMSREAVTKLCSEHGFTKILVIATKISNRIKTIAAFEHGSILASNILLRKSKHAIVVSQNNRNDFEFICTVGTNRCACIKLFEQKDVAITWLNNNIY